MNDTNSIDIKNNKKIFEIYPKLCLLIIKLNKKMTYIYKKYNITFMKHDITNTIKNKCK